MKKFYPYNLKQTLLYFSAAFFSLVIGCRHSPEVKQSSHDGITVQIRELPAGNDGTATKNFAARLTPDKILLSSAKKDLNNSMAFGMDSTFYMQSGKEKVYPNLIQAVPNGIKGSFEYLVSFEPAPDQSKRWQLVYNDKYLNHKLYYFN